MSHPTGASPAPRTAGTTRRNAPDVTVMPSSVGTQLTWLEDGVEKPFSPVPESDVTWLDELGSQTREHDTELRKARRDRRDPPDRTDEESGLTWV